MFKDRVRKALQHLVLRQHITNSPIPVYFLGVGAMPVAKLPPLTSAVKKIICNNTGRLNHPTGRRQGTFASPHKHLFLIPVF